MATRDIGLAVIALGGGRHLASDSVDARVGFSHVVQRGQLVEAGQRLARVHAADAAGAEAAQRHLLASIEMGDVPPATAPALMLQRLAEPTAVS
jgi:thymidine phosphorylase